MNSPFPPGIYYQLMPEGVLGRQSNFILAGVMSGPETANALPSLPTIIP